MATALEVLLALREAVAAADREREALADFDAATPPSAERDADADRDRDAVLDGDDAPPRDAERDGDLVTDRDDAPPLDADRDRDAVPPLDAERDRETEADGNREALTDRDADSVGCENRQFCERSPVSTALHTELRAESSMRSVWPAVRSPQQSARFQKLRFASTKLAPRSTSQNDVLSTLMSIVQKKEPRLPSTAALASQIQRKFADAALFRATFVPMKSHASTSAKFMPDGEPGVFSTRM